MVNLNNELLKKPTYLKVHGADSNQGDPNKTSRSQVKRQGDVSKRLAKNKRANSQIKVQIKTEPNEMSETK